MADSTSSVTQRQLLPPNFQINARPRQESCLSRIAIIWASFIHWITNLFVTALECLTPARVQRPIPVPALGNQVLSFLDGNPDRQGRTFEGILGWIETNEGRRRLKDNHDWVQQLFPNIRPSDFRSDANIWVMPPDVAPVMKTPIYQEKIRRAFQMVLRFYQLDNGVAGINIQNLPWLKSGDHNYRRITRILHALVLAGLYEEARHFLNLLTELHQLAPTKISRINLQFWQEAAVPAIASEAV